MLRRYNTLLTCLVITLVLSLPVAAATDEEKFDKLAAEILESLQSFFPVHATEMGIHEYDHRFTDYSDRAVKRMVDRLEDYEDDLKDLDNADLPPAKKIDYKLIRSNVEIALLKLDKIEWHKKLPQLYVNEAIDGLYYVMNSQGRPLSEKLPVVLGRMEAVPALFATARKNIKQPPQVWIDLAHESLEAGIEFYRQVGSELMNKFPDRASEILRTSTKAREAMNDFLTFLDQVEVGQPTSFAVGKENFDFMLQRQYFLPYDSDSLLKIGETLLAEAQSEYRDYEDYLEEHHQDGQDSVFVPSVFSKSDIMDYYQWEVEQVKTFLKVNDIVTVPDNIAECVVIETPDYLRPMIPGIAYQPAGPFDPKELGYFFVRPIPDDLDRRQLEARYRYVHRRGFKGSVVHEAYPGHHLQMQIAGMHESDIRKWQHNTMMIEGWSLYCEEMMYEAGLYGEADPAMWLAILGGIRFRAARIIADVKLHTGQFTYQECVDWMIEVLDGDTESEKDYLRRSVRKYTLTPTIWMSYLMGKHEIERLLLAAQDEHGAMFDTAAFYDALLAEGSIPPALMWEIFDLEPVTVPE